VIFFDESIDAKLNRYTFRFHSIDTPFLQHERSQKRHQKTYVPPSPALSGLNNFIYSYKGRFPELKEELYTPPRNLTARFPKRSEQLINMVSGVRLKRKNLLNPVAPSGKGEKSVVFLSGAACVFSAYLVCLCRFISLSAENIAKPKHRSSVVTTKQILEEFSSFGNNDSFWTTRGREGSVVERLVRFSTASDEPISPKKVLEAANLALKVVFQVLNRLIGFDYTPDEVVYR
jgi:hypothetical protein